MAENKDKKETMDDLESLIPSNPNMGRKRRPKKDKNTKKPSASRKKTKKQELEGISSQKTSDSFLDEEDKVDYYQFGQDGSKIDPFKDALSFTYYYRYYLTAYSDKKPNFTVYSYDVIQAGKILDTLKKNGKKDDIRFLNGWIRYYMDIHLMDNRIYNVEHTSMDSFYKTLSKYKNIAFLD
jgi:hypothetical protein